MKTLLILTLLFFTACTSENEELYENAKLEISMKLNSPSSAVFPEFNEDMLIILDKTGKDVPLKWINPIAYGGMINVAEKGKYYESLEKKYDYDYAELKLSFDADNPFGVSIRRDWRVVFMRWHYPEGLSDWGFIKATKQ